MSREPTTGLHYGYLARRAVVAQKEADEAFERGDRVFGKIRAQDAVKLRALAVEGTCRGY